VIAGHLAATLSISLALVVWAALSLFAPLWTELARFVLTAAAGGCFYAALQMARVAARAGSAPISGPR
jgi:hypothetical protein